MNGGEYFIDDFYEVQCRLCFPERVCHHRCDWFPVMTDDTSGKGRLIPKIEPNIPSMVFSGQDRMYARHCHRFFSLNRKYFRVGMRAQLDGSVEHV